jgi:hypothetical protein
MGMDANIICIGPFSHDIIDCLNYDAEDYEGTEEGKLISVTLCHCNTTDQSNELARCFKELDSHDFNTHHITEDRVQWISLSMMEFENPSQWERLEKLLQHGFTCIYQPNY